MPDPIQFLDNFGEVRQALFDFVNQYTEINDQSRVLPAELADSQNELYTRPAFKDQNGNRLGPYCTLRWNSKGLNRGIDEKRTFFDKDLGKFDVSTTGNRISVVSINCYDLPIEDLLNDLHPADVLERMCSATYRASNVRCC